MSNKEYLKSFVLMERFHSLLVDENTKVYDHINTLNGISNQLETIGDKDLRL